MKKKKPAVCYYRVSTPRQGEVGLSLPAQRKAIRAFVKANGFQLHKEFTDVDSGANNNRNALEQALLAVENVDGTLLIARIDRLARNVELVAHLMNTHVPFIAIDNPGADKFSNQIDAVVAEREHDLNSLRTKAGLEIARDRGVELGWYGRYVQSKINHRQSIKFAKKMGPMIKKLKSRGISTIRAITDALNTLNVPTYRNNGQRWHIATVHKIIKTLRS